MKNVGTGLAAICGTALIVLTSTAPATADPGRHHWRQHGNDQKHTRKYDPRRDRNRPKIIFGTQPHHYLDVEPGRNFGVRPDSYTCYGYDCNW